MAPTVSSPVEGEAVAAAQPRVGWRDAFFGLGAALCWAASPVFIRKGLADLPSPLISAWVGMVACTLVYGAVLLARPRRNRSPIPRRAMAVQLLAAVLSALATWARWVAVDLIPVAMAITVGRISVPVVLLVSPLVLGSKLERVTLRLWLGSALIVGGSVLLVLYG